MRPLLSFPSSTHPLITGHHLRPQADPLFSSIRSRYQPIISPAQEVVFSGQLGTIKRVDSRFDKDFGDLPLEHRMLNPSLAGGALYDLGPYALLWSTLFLYQHPNNAGEWPKEVKAVMRKDERTGVDAAMSWLMSYENLGATVSRLESWGNGA